MQLVTVGDGLLAVQSLSNDIVTTMQSVVSTQSSGNFITGWFGGDMVASQSISLLQQLATYAQTAAADLGGDPTQPLDAEQINRLQVLQSEVIEDRALIGQAISSVDWTYGDLVSDVATQTQNLASQAVAAVSTGLGINWTLVEIGGAVLAVVLAVALYKRVRG